MRALEPEMRALQRALAGEISDPSAVYHVLDTPLIPAMARVRVSRGGLFAGQATFFGRSASKTEWVYGFKVELVVSPEGVVTSFSLAPAASDERSMEDALVASDRHDAYHLPSWPTRGSRGGGVGATTLAGEVHRALVAATPKNNERRAWLKADRRWASGKRQEIIEGVIGQHKDFSSAWSAIARRPWVDFWRVWRPRRSPAATRKEYDARD